MPPSTFLAKLIGPVAVVVGIGVLANGAVYRELSAEFLRSPALIYLSGLLAMTAGVALILHHNVWIADWRVLITLLGWLAAIGGALRILFPQAIEASGRWLLTHPVSITVSAVVWLVVGAVLCFYGYCRESHMGAKQ